MILVKPLPPTWALIKTIGGVKVYYSARHQAVWFESGIKVDADGAFESAHLDSKRGLDRLENMRGALVRDEKGEPVVQGPHDPAPGFLITQTALIDPSIKSERNPRRYVQSDMFPYSALPPALVSRRRDPSPVLPGLGDLGWALCRTTGLQSWHILADVGPEGRAGEGSIRLVERLGVNANARAGGCDGGVEWLFFVGSRSERRWPRPDAETVAASLMRGLAMDP